MRASVSYRMAKGEVATNSMAAHPAVGPAIRLPANQANGMVASPMTPESDRVATSEWPNQPIQTWSMK
jgi:hypothetical protein